MDQLENLYSLIYTGQSTPEVWLKAWVTYENNDSINEQIRTDLEYLKGKDVSINTLAWVKNGDLRQVYINIKTLMMLYEQSWYEGEENQTWRGECCGFCTEKSRQYETGYCRNCIVLYRKIAKLSNSPVDEAMELYRKMSVDERKRFLAECSQL